MGTRIDTTSLTGYNTRNDYSMLLNSLPSRSGVSGAANLNFLSDYASIKNGSYGKLMRAYYGPDRERLGDLANNSSISGARDSAKTLKEIESSSDALKTSADKLLATGANSLFNEKDITTKDENGVSTTTRGLDVDAIYKAVSTFVNDYNNVLEKGATANTASITGKVASLQGMGNANKNTLERVGISVAADGQLSMDEEKFKGADMTTVKSLFNSHGSFAFRVSAQASWVSFAAGNEATKSNTYNAQGALTNNLNTGNIFGSYF